MRKHLLCKPNDIEQSLSIPEYHKLVRLNILSDFRFLSNGKKKHVLIKNILPIKTFVELVLNGLTSPLISSININEF